MRKTDIFWDIPVALALLTRLPLPRIPERCFAHQARAAWAFPLAGLLVAGAACAIGVTALRLGLPPLAAAGLLLATQTILTGAMHEDGLADSADGLWGGFTRDRRLEIMKDSLIGSYGVLALILVTGLRWIALAYVLPNGGVSAVLACAVLSRAPLAGLMTVVPPARTGGLSRSVGRPGSRASSVAICLALGGTLLIAPTAVMPATLAILAVSLATALIVKAKIGGQTGDILGATQVLGETAALLTLTALL